ncbi:adenosine 3'-phospho 5'-phosphosulfate transporter 2-like [Branchiostoma floridae x Branchiostoma belcheri]
MIKSRNTSIVNMANMSDTTTKQGDPDFTNLSNGRNVSITIQEGESYISVKPAGEKQPDEVRVLGVSLSGLPRAGQFLVCVGGVFFFYLMYGYVLELIFRLEGFKPFGWYLTLVQFAFYSVFGAGELQFKADKTRRIPMKTYCGLAFLTVATMGLSNSAVGYLNYPTQVIFKCCKLIPVMIGGVLIQGKRYGMIDVTACLCMTFGLIFFTLADVEVQPNFDTHGVVLISLALVADAVIGNVQEKTMKAHSASNTEVVLYSYSVGFVYILVGLLVSGELLEPIRFCAQYPGYTYGLAAALSVTGYVGINFVLTLVKSFGALPAVTVTTCRKAVTIILSFIFFTKPFTMQYVWSALLVTAGILLSTYSKNQLKMDALIQHYVLHPLFTRQGRSSGKTEFV